MRHQIPLQQQQQQQQQSAETIDQHRKHRVLVSFVLPNNKSESTLVFVPVYSRLYTLRP